MNAGEFEGDALLATINTSKITDFGATAFKGCAALTTIDLSKAASLGESTFEASGLISVSFPKSVAAIPASCFKDCEALATVTFADDYATFTKIAEYAFAYTAIAEIAIPACLPANTANGVETKAFGGCELLKKFTYNTPEETVGNIKVVVNDNAFLGCSNVVFVTTEAYQEANPIAPKNSNYVEVDPETAEIAMTKFAKADKYYYKWKNTTADIKIKKTDAKVYDAYRDEVDGTLNMIQFKPKGGYIYIKKNQVALIISDNDKVNYEAGDGSQTSWVDPAAQILIINADAVERLDAEAAAIGAGFDYIYGWINSATKGTGFGKVTSGKTLPAGTLYLYANEDDTAAAPGLNVVWRDENGNIEEEVTGINEIFSNVQKNGEMYNLQGVRVNGAAQKGIYIQNGKKFVVK